MPISRRTFVVGCSAAIAAMAGGRIGQLVFAEEGDLPFKTYLPGIGRIPAASNEIFVFVFLRGGCDGLSLVAPFDDPIYTSARRGLSLPGSGDGAALVIDPRNPSFTSSLGLHPNAAPLKELYDSQQLAIVHACGLNDDTRSHFDAMDYIERGTPGNKATSTGWLARHLQSVAVAGQIPTLAADSALPTSLLGDLDAVAMDEPGSYRLRGHSRYTRIDDPNDQKDNDANYISMMQTLERLYVGPGTLHDAGRRTIETIAIMRELNLDYTPQPGVAYPNNSFGESLETIARIIKLNLGLHVATVDLGGWDTHEDQGTNGGYYAARVDDLARGLHALYNDLPNHRDRLTIVVMSEFGRRLGANASGGTDHGHGNVMLVLGGSVNGGSVYGAWPGLEDLDQKQDLKITTDYRNVLGEIVVERLGNPRLGYVFPGLTAADYQPLDLVRGAAPGPVDFNG